jgi:hypothetical protein
VAARLLLSSASVRAQPIRSGKSIREQFQVPELAAHGASASRTSAVVTLSPSRAWVSRLRAFCWVGPIGRLTPMSRDDITYVLDMALTCQVEDEDDDRVTGRSGLGPALQKQRTARREARRDRYSRLLAEQLGGSRERMAAAAREGQVRLTAMEQPAYWSRRWDDISVDRSRASADAMFSEKRRDEFELWSCALDLCGRAAALSGPPGAGADEQAGRTS